MRYDLDFVYQLSCELGLLPQSIQADPLTFTLATERCCSY